METTVKIPNREIALAAFDWEIDTALHQCGGEPKTGYGHMAHFHFDGETEMETEKYERLKEENR